MSKVFHVNSQQSFSYTWALPLKLCLRAMSVTMGGHFLICSLVSLPSSVSLSLFWMSPLPCFPITAGAVEHSVPHTRTLHNRSPSHCHSVLLIPRSSRKTPVLLTLPRCCFQEERYSINLHWRQKNRRRSKEVCSKQPLFCPALNCLENWIC